MPEFLSHHEIILWEHATRKITKTSRYHAQTFCEPLNLMEGTWKEIGYTVHGQKSGNSLFGFNVINASSTVGGIGNTKMQTAHGER